MVVNNVIQMAEQRELFRQAIIASLRNWDILKVAVDQEWAGENSAAIRDWMPDAVLQLFDKGDKVYPDMLDDYLCDIMAQAIKSVLMFQWNI
eukprot:m.251933 g.251933  ORF g.251933 m.251933 type:complete len:92 (+) comp16153_c0_seq6:2200-2475(+)